MTKQYDAIIIGGGHNGLTTAGYLAKAGMKTLVLERRPISAFFIRNMLKLLIAIFQISTFYRGINI